ncbi:MAG: SM-20-related protein [Sulfitobacter sp.]|jgi:SM-20-related protein
MLNIDKFKDTPLITTPFQHLLVEEFISPDTLARVTDDYPEVPGGGSHYGSTLKIEGAFKEMMDHMQGPEFQKAMEEKFDYDLSNRPITYTVRGFCRAKDGSIHTDSKTKIFTVLLYLNDLAWSIEGGRLRLLNGGSDLEDYFTEVDPKGGTLLVFKRADNSWHGHHPYEGPRRAIQINWLTDEAALRREEGRRGLLTKVKGMLRGSAA